MKSRGVRGVLAASMAGALAVTALGACSRVKAVDATRAREARGPIQIWYSNNPQEVQWGKKTVAGWNAAHPTEKVVAQEIPTGKSSEAVISASIIAGSEPCLVYNTSPASVPSFQAEGGLVDLDQFPGGREYIEQRSGSLAGQYRSPDGNYYQLPWKSNPVMIFYNKKLFAKAGLDPNHPKLSSYTDFLATARTLVKSRAARYAIYPAPTSEFFQSWFDFYPMFAAESGGRQLLKNNTVQFDDAAGRAVAGFWRTLYADGLAGRDAYTGDAFADGVSAMSTVGPWAITVYKGKVDWGVVPVPTSTGSPSKHTFSDAKNVAMYASCRNRSTAWDFLKYSTSEAADGQLLDITGQIPNRVDVRSVYAPYFKAHPAYAAFAALAENVVEVPNVPNSVEIWQDFRDGWSRSVIFGKQPVDASLQSTARSINTLVRKK